MEDFFYWDDEQQCFVDILEADNEGGEASD